MVNFSNCFGLVIIKPNGLAMVSCGKSVVIFHCAANIINVCEFPLGNLVAINYTRCWQQLFFVCAKFKLSLVFFIVKIAF